MLEESTWVEYSVFIRQKPLVEQSVSNCFLRPHNTVQNLRRRFLSSQTNSKKQKDITINVIYRFEA